MVEPKQEKNIIRLETFSALISSRAICRVTLFKLKLSAILKLFMALFRRQTGRTVSERISEHERNLRMPYFDKSAVAEHALENNHHIGFDEARLIDRATNCWDRIRREANFNRDSGLHISKAWDPAISALRRLQARGQHSTSAPALATPGVNQCTGRGERPF